MALQLPEQTYVYRPLSIKESIRVAEIQPGHHGSPIQVRLTELLLPSGQQQQCLDKYETLSYEWGEVARTRPISCDDKTTLITKNLEAALQRLRSPDTPIRLWIDSLCINQEDMQERNSQVGLMPLIYKSATRVYMWLGEQKTDTPKALKMVEDLAKFLTLIRKRVEATEQSGRKRRNIPTIASERALKMLVGDELPIDLEDTDSWDAVSEIFSRTYFQRTWIAQEILLSWNATVVCGSHRLRWTILRDAALCTSKITCLQVFDKNQSLAYCQLMALATFHNMLPASGGGRKLVLIDLLQCLRWSRCRDPRDYVYGVIGMAAYPYGGIGHSKPLDVCIPPPDYSKPVEVIYQETTTGLIKEHGNLKVLFNIQCPRLRTFNSMPSWVIDWSASPDDWWRQHSKPGDNIDSKNASTLRENQPSFPTPHAVEPLFPGEIEIMDRLLIAEGVSLGTVGYVSGILNAESLLKGVSNISSKMGEMHGNTWFKRYVNGQSISNVIVNTLLRNQQESAATTRGFDTTGERFIGLQDWTPMYESFMGVLVLSNVREKFQEEYSGVMLKYVMTKAVVDLKAGLFLAASRTIQNNRFFSTSTGLLGLGNMDIKPGDSIVMLKGALAPLVLRRQQKDGGKWAIVGDAYVHAAMEVNEHVYTEDLLKSFKEYRIS